MSGSPVFSLRRLQTAIKTASGHDVPSLSLASALLAEMGESDSLRFDRLSLVVYHDRLTNWQVADKVLAALSSKPDGLELNRATLLDLYSVYCGVADTQGVTPMAFSTFRVRAYKTPAARAKVEANASAI